MVHKILSMPVTSLTILNLWEHDYCSGWEWADLDLALPASRPICEAAG
jgi:hypothetical protein